MIIDANRCIGCGNCIRYCPLHAISIGPEGKARINLDVCCECFTCFRFAKCPQDAISESELAWPRNVRRAFSDPICPPEVLGIINRGGIEVKTNDVTARYGPKELTIGVEFGRPKPGVYLIDVQVMCHALRDVPVIFQPESPITSLMSSPIRGDFWPELLNERVMSIILNIDMTLDKLPSTLQVLKNIAPKLKSVFSISIVSYINDDGSMPAIETAIKEGFKPLSSSKVNLGLGRPLRRFSFKEVGI